MATRRAILANAMATAIASAAGAVLRPRASYSENQAAGDDGVAGSSVAGSINERMTGDISPVHDPCIMKEGDTYYVYGTAMPGSPGITVRTSKDLIHWASRGSIVSSIPAWALEAIPGTKGMWAPDVSFFNGQYHLYYAVSTFGSNRSAIGLFTSPTLDPDSSHYGWKDRGLVLMSKDEDDFNAIDPNHIADRDGRHWLLYGSFWTGIKMRRMDPGTGKPSVEDARIYSLAQRLEPTGAPDPIEAPFMIERNGYYYLFASYDYCCKGAQSTYYTAYGRSASITGPFAGRTGNSMLEGGGTVILRADLKEQQRWRGPGHCAILRDDAQDYIVYHAYDIQNHAIPTLRIAPLIWSDDGWPSVKT